jgi:hypothetical protein
MDREKHPVDEVRGPGTLIVGITEDYNYVSVQFTDPKWWIHFTPEEARNVAGLLLKKARDIEDSRKNVGEN